MLTKNTVLNTSIRQEKGNPFTKTYKSKVLLNNSSIMSDPKEDTKNELSIIKNLGKKIDTNGIFFKVPMLYPDDTEIVRESSSYFEPIAIEKKTHRKYSIDAYINNSTKKSNIIQIVQKLSLQTRQQLCKLSSIPLIPAETINTMKVNFPMSSPSKKTMVIDLDETLIYSQVSAIGNSEPIYACGDIHYIKVRPGARELLEAVSKSYEIIIFTASQKEYADKSIAVLDTKKYVSYVLYRENCVVSNNQLIKDLRIINRDLQNVVLIDNCVLCMAPQPENGILVRSYYGEEKDTELDYIRNFLLTNSTVACIRDVVSETFNIKQLAEFSRLNSKQILKEGDRV